MQINGNEIRPGFIIEHNGRLCLAIKTQHTQPGKGGAYLQVELKDIRDGTKLNERFRSSESVERVRLEEKEFQVLFGNKDKLISSDELTFMDQETYEQITLPRDLIGDSAVYLQEGMMVTVSTYEEEVVNVKIPDKVIMTIIECQAVVKGQTASASYKPAIIENGVRILVPPHIDSGIKIVINTEDNTYIERAK